MVERQRPSTDGAAYGRPAPYRAGCARAERVGECADSGGVDELGMAPIHDEVDIGPKNSPDDLAKAHGGRLIEFACRREPNTPVRSAPRSRLPLSGRSGGLSASALRISDSRPAASSVVAGRLVRHATPPPRR